MIHKRAKCSVSFRIGGVTILRKGKSDFISDGEAGLKSTDEYIL